MLTRIIVWALIEKFNLMIPKIKNLAIRKIALKKEQPQLHRVQIVKLKLNNRLKVQNLKAINKTLKQIKCNFL